MPACPFGWVIYDAIIRLNLGYGAAIKRINAARIADGEKTAEYDRTSLNRWLRGTIPRGEGLRWIASALEIDLEELSRAAERTRHGEGHVPQQAATESEPANATDTEGPRPQIEATSVEDQAQPSLSLGDGTVLGITSADDVKRRHFLHILTTGAGLSLLNQASSSTDATGATTQLPKTWTQAIHDIIDHSVSKAWERFHTADVDQMTEVSQLQLYLLRQHHRDLEVRDASLLFSTAYRLVGAVQHRNGYYAEALRTQNTAYLAALEAGDAWSMAESRSWQAYDFRALGRHADTESTIEAALRLIAERSDTAAIRLRARLLASGAENAAVVGDEQRAEAMLRESETLLSRLPRDPNEEFDQSGWLETAATCSLHLGQAERSIEYFNRALVGLPKQWLARRSFSAIGLAGAFATLRDREATVATVQGLVPSLQAAKSNELTRHFISSIPKLLACFPHDDELRDLAATVETGIGTDV